MLITLAETIIRLKSGEVVAIPTETVYGLAADAHNEEAIQQIYAIKQRPANNPLIVHIGGIDQVTDWASDFPPLAQKLAAAFWPGALTLVLPAKDTVSTIVRAGEPTVALRVPNHPLTLKLLRTSQLGLAAPSANKYTQLSPTTAAHVENSLGKEIAVLDGGACQVGIESTIVSVEHEHWQLLRHGMISEQAITEIAGKPALSTTHTPKAPGQHLLHYSPKTPSLAFESRTALINHANQNPNCSALLIGDGDSPACQYLTLANQPQQAATDLYDYLHQLDQHNTQQLLIELPPKQAAWLAIRDRLLKATYQP